MPFYKGSKIQYWVLLHRKEINLDILKLIIMGHRCLNKHDTPC